MSTAGQEEYVLGSSDREIERLAYQHEVWLGETVALWESAGIELGSWVADFGCGPGFCTKALSRLVGPEGHIFGVDASSRFASIVEEEAAKSDNITFFQGNASQTPIESDSVDAVFARWLFCFLPDPERTIKEIVRILKPGGRVVILDYFNYLSCDVFPQRREISQLFDGYMEDILTHGGTYNIGGMLPEMLVSAGFEIESLVPVNKIARPGSRVWRWVEYFTEVSVPRLVESDIWTADQRIEFEDAWKEAADDPATFFYPPPMIGIIASHAG